MLDAMIAALPQAAVRGPDEVSQPAAQGGAPDFAATLAAALTARAGAEAAKPGGGPVVPGAQPAVAQAGGGATVTAQPLAEPDAVAALVQGAGMTPALPASTPADDALAPAAGAARPGGPDEQPTAVDQQQGAADAAETPAAADAAHAADVPAMQLVPVPAPLAVLVPAPPTAHREAATAPEESLAVSTAPAAETPRARRGGGVAHGQPPVSAGQGLPAAAPRSAPAEAGPAPADAPRIVAEDAAPPQAALPEPRAGRTAPDATPPAVAPIPAFAAAEQIAAANDLAPTPAEAQPRGATPPAPSLAFALPDAPAERATPPTTADAPRPAPPPAAPPRDAPGFGFASDPARQAFDLRLDTPGLGAVEVEVRHADGAAEVVVRSDRADTLAVLARDGAELDRALRDAGIGPEGRSMSFLLAEGDGQTGQRQRGPGARLSPPEPLPVPGGAAPRGTSLSLLDIHV